MFPTQIKTIKGLRREFPTEESCIKYLEFRRWNGTVESPFAKGGKVWVCANGKYRCSITQKYFTVKTGSMYEKTKIPLRDWFEAIWYMLEFKKGVPSTTMANLLEVTQKTAWFMCQKIRRSLGMDEEAPLEQGIFELDEACFGGLQINRHEDKKIPNSQGGHGADKTWVLGILQRNGNLRTIQMPSREVEFAQSIIRKLIPAGSVLITDAWKGYSGLNDAYHHYVVKDGNKNTRNYNPEIHTNNIEGSWGSFKRGYNGIYNWWSKKQLKYYLNEFTFRFNARKKPIFEMFETHISNIDRRITYNDVKNELWT